MLTAERTCGSDRGVTGTPSTAIEPPSWFSSPFMHRRIVDLPDPDGPIRQATSPGAISKLTSRSTARAP